MFDQTPCRFNRAEGTSVNARKSRAQCTVNGRFSVVAATVAPHFKFLESTWCESCHCSSEKAPSKGTENGPTDVPASDLNFER